MLPSKKGLVLGVDADFHALEDLEIFFGEIEVCGFAFGIVVAGVGPQPNLQPQR